VSVLEQLLDRVRHLGQSPEEGEEHILPVAAATLLLEVAWADHEIADAELDTIRRTLKAQFALDASTIETIIQESEKRQRESVGLYSFTRTITESWSEPQRFELVVALWRLALADDSLDGFEEYMIRKIADLLYVSHSRFIEAKLLARSRQTSE
jgi:uncharacterized tellurite resistance protein B-like protein